MKSSLRNIIAAAFILMIVLPSTPRQSLADDPAARAIMEKVDARDDGDNQTSETLPNVSNIDVLLLNAWINESGAVHWIEGARIAINKMKANVTLPGHILELGHLNSGNAVPYRDPIASDNGTLASEYLGMIARALLHCKPVEVQHSCARTPGDNGRSPVA